jgi:hypothetical protein
MGYHKMQAEADSKSIYACSGLERWLSEVTSIFADCDSPAVSIAGR